MMPHRYASAASMPTLGYCIDGMSVLRSRGQANAVPQRVRGYSTHQRGPHSFYAADQRGFGGMIFRQNHGFETYRGGVMPQKYYDIATPKSNFQRCHNDLGRRYGAFHGDANAASRHYQHRADGYGAHDVNPDCKRNSDNLICPDRGRAIEGVGLENSLCPHGDAVPEDWLGDWELRPECPRSKWKYEENPTWQPSVKSRTHEYSGSELIQARGEHKLSHIYSGLTDFAANVSAQPWQLVFSRVESQDVVEQGEDCLQETRVSSGYTSNSDIDE